MIRPIGNSCMGHRAAKGGDPVWDLATLFPAQGSWTERDYLALDTNRLIELTDGYLEVLPMPTLFHQLIVKFLFIRIEAHVTRGVGGLTNMNTR